MGNERKTIRKNKAVVQPVSIGLWVKSSSPGDVAPLPWLSSTAHTLSNASFRLWLTDPPRAPPPGAPHSPLIGRAHTGATLLQRVHMVAIFQCWIWVKITSAGAPEGFSPSLSLRLSFSHLLVVFSLLSALFQSANANIWLSAHMTTAFSLLFKNLKQTLSSILLWISTLALIYCWINSWHSWKWTSLRPRLTVYTCTHVCIHMNASSPDDETESNFIFHGKLARE